MWRGLALIAVSLLSGCTQATTRTETVSSPSQERTGAEVVNVTGFGEIRIGSTRADLGSHLGSDLPGCNTQLRGYPQGSAVFTNDDRFVLLWFNEPLKTPEGVTTGTSFAQVKAAYPQAVELTAPAGSHQFGGLLVVSGQYGYLFLHDGKTVQKAVAGYTAYLQRLFDTGFGVC
jgi:hypothetical protein